MPDTIPKSPDELEPAIHGKVSGVSRIGRRAIGLIALVGFGLILLILYGIGQTGSKLVAVAVLPTAPPNQPADITTEHFGASEPLALPTAAPTESPLQLSSPVPASAPPAAAAETSGTAVTAAPEPVTVPAVEATSAAAARRAAADDARAAAHTARLIREQAARDAAAATLALSKKAPIVLAGEAAPGQSQAQAAAGSAAVPATETGATGSAAAANSFLNGPTGQLANGAAQNPVVTDRIEPTTPFEIVAGSVIPAILITAVNSENPGLLTAQVREDVYDSLTGRNLLVPRGSRLIGVYKNEIGKGQSRILVAWKRLIFPDTSAIDLVNMSGADVEGSAGFEGRTDTHFSQILSQALLASVITAGFQLSQPQQQTASTGSGTVVVISPGQQAASAVGQTVAQTITSQLSSTQAIPPTIYIPRGYPFVVIVDRDLVLPAPYRP